MLRPVVLGTDLEHELRRGHRYRNIVDTEWLAADSKLSFILLEDHWLRATICGAGRRLAANPYAGRSQRKQDEDRDFHKTVPLIQDDFRQRLYTTA